MAKVPSGNKKPTKKKLYSLDEYLKKKEITEHDLKPVEWYKTSQALQDATGLPGFPKGYIALSRGFSNTGKSTSVFEGIVAAQKAGDLAIIIDLENNIGDYRLTEMGFDWNGPHIKVDQEYLSENYAKKSRKKDSKGKLIIRTEASIEDLADCVNGFLNDQEAGKLPFNILFVIDSIGVLNCNMSINAQDKGTSDNNQWNAGAYEHAFKSILNSRIPASRKKNKEYTNTLIAVQKIWIDNMGAGVVKHKGGEAFFFGARLIYHHGGIAAHGTRGVTATSKGKKVQYGVETKVVVAKNHIDGPLGGISMEGKIISTLKGFVSPEKLDDYKKENILYFRKLLGDEVNPEDIKTKYHQIDSLNDIQDADDLNDTYKTNFGIDTDTGEVLDE
jgi:hypothetical protein